jgi:DNA adenine methylase/adenine-specific DNA-methyltransferase
MGNKHRLLPWIWETLDQIPFDSALDLFSGSGSVAYLLKSMGKRVVANDFLKFAYELVVATVENSSRTIDDSEVETLCRRTATKDHFIEKTFSDIFFERSDLRFLDNIWANLREVTDRHAISLVLASLTRACLKRQPRGVFTVSGSKYDDGRRDLRVSLIDHFKESVAVFNQLVFDNRQLNSAIRGDAIALETPDIDLVYMDPPYVPRADDNCYVKRYHFLEGLSSYWQEAGTEIVQTSRVKKIRKRYTPFSYRHTAIDAFDSIFRQFAEQTIVLSYSSNGYPDLETLVRVMGRHKRCVDVVSKDHRYHFGTHSGVSEGRKTVKEYLIVGTG